VTISEMPTHTHVLNAANKDGTVPAPTGQLLAQFSSAYRQPTSLVPLLAGTVTNTGGSQAHENMSPYLTLNFCIALQGIFPSQT